MHRTWRVCRPAQAQSGQPGQRSAHWHAHAAAGAAAQGGRAWPPAGSVPLRTPSNWLAPRPASPQKDCRPPCLRRLPHYLAVDHRLGTMKQGRGRRVSAQSRGLFEASAYAQPEVSGELWPDQAPANPVSNLSFIVIHGANLAWQWGYATARSTGRRRVAHKRRAARERKVIASKSPLPVAVCLAAYLAYQASVA